MKPAGDTRASTEISLEVTAIAPSSTICREYDSATATNNNQACLNKKTNKYILTM